MYNQKFNVLQLLLLLTTKMNQKIFVVKRLNFLLCNKTKTKEVYAMKLNLF